jgi:hypothetical protein
VLKVLHGALVLLRRRARLERTEIPPASSLRVLFARVETVLAGFELSDHVDILALLIKHTSKALPQAPRNGSKI